MPRNLTAWSGAAACLTLWLSVDVATQGAATAAQHDTREISTEELQAILSSRSATVLDARPAAEYTISHIPGAVNVAPKPGVPLSMYVSDVAEIGRVVHNNKSASLVLYCNGPHCGKSKRLASELLEAGYSNVRRYQLGIPMWRAAGGVCEVELEGIRHIVANDGTAVVIDARETARFQKGTLRGHAAFQEAWCSRARYVGEVKRAKDDGRLPMEDHNTRILVIGPDGAAARYVAEALAREAFHNVSYFAGSVHGGAEVTDAPVIPMKHVSRTAAPPSKRRVRFSVRVTSSGTSGRP